MTIPSEPIPGFTHLQSYNLRRLKVHVEDGSVNEADLSIKRMRFLIHLVQAGVYKIENLDGDIIINPKKGSK